MDVGRSVSDGQPSVKTGRRLLHRLRESTRRAFIAAHEK